MAPLLERSGCGLSLKTGTIIIGVLQALAGFCMMVSEALAAHKHPGTGRHLPPSAVPQPSPDPAPDPGSADDPGGDPSRLVQGQPGFCAVLSVAGALLFVVSVLLLYGADYEKPRLVKPWVVYSMVLSTAIVAVYFGLAILTFVVAGHNKFGYSILVGILGTTALSTYFILIVYSFYRELVERSRVPCII